MFGRDGSVPWYEARRDATGLAPNPATTPEAVIQVYAARAVAWRGVFAVLAAVSLAASLCGAYLFVLNARAATARAGAAVSAHG